MYHKLKTRFSNLIKRVGGYNVNLSDWLARQRKKETKSEMLKKTGILSSSELLEIYFNEVYSRQEH